MRRVGLMVAITLSASPALGGTPIPGSGEITFEQNFDHSFLSAGPTDGGYAKLLLSTSDPVQQGDLIYMAVAVSPQSTDIQSVDDSQGNVYSQAFSLEPGFNAWSFGIYWTIAQSDGPLTISFDMQRADLFDVHGLVYRGIRPVVPIDATSRGGSQTDTVMDCQLQTTAKADLLVAFMPSAGPVFALGTTANSRSQLNGDLVEDRIADGPGLYTLTARANAAPWWGQCVAFFADSTSAEGGVGGTVGGGTTGGGGSSDGGVFGGDGGDGLARLSSDLGCSSTQGVMSLAGVALVLGVLCAGRRRHVRRDAR